MTSCNRRLTAAPVALEAPFQVRKPRPVVEISSLHWFNANQRPEILLRSTATSRLLVVKAVGKSEGGDVGKKAGACSYSLEDGSVVDRTVEEMDCRTRGRNQTVEVAIAAAATVVLGVGNRVLYKLALVPLKHYPFFLAQLATFGNGVIDVMSKV